MVPSRLPATASWGRCPRLRGDGPAAAVLRQHGAEVSPPTRGWSLPGRKDGPGRTGVPAYAGMVPPGHAGAPGGRWCPRLRGDGPQRQATGVAPNIGVPAYAGMVPAGEAWESKLLGCPRLRGDGPPHTQARPLPSRVSPPTRGWSRVPAGHMVVDRGVPAYAGMVPPLGAGDAGRCRCPRLRGDGPRIRINSGGYASVSPPTRGWSAMLGVGSSQAPGVPAYAGMVPRNRFRSGWS